MSINILGLFFDQKPAAEPPLRGSAAAVRMPVGETTTACTTALCPVLFHQCPSDKRPAAKPRSAGGLQRRHKLGSEVVCHVSMRPCVHVCVLCGYARARAHVCVGGWRGGWVGGVCLCVCVRVYVCVCVCLSMCVSMYVYFVCVSMWE